MTAYSPEEKVPAPVTEAERWIVHNRVDSIKVEYVQTGTDTAETFVTLGAGKEKRRWTSATFNQVARLSLSWASVAEPNYGVRERVEAREKYEKNNAAELATYKRLKAKYEGAQP